MRNYLGRLRGYGAGLVAAVALWSAQPAQAADDVSVELVETGKGKKAELRLAPPKGTEQSTRMVMKMSMSMKMMGQEIPMDLPATTMDMKVKVDDVDSSGNVAFTYELVDVGVGASELPGVQDAMLAELKKMVGTVGTGKTSPRGENLGGSVKVPDGVDPAQAANMEKGLANAGFVLPEAPVGVGAKWTVTQDVEQDNLKMKQVTTYTLAERQGDKVKLDVSVVQTADEQDVELPNLPPGATAKLTSLDSKGGGETQLDLGYPMPMASSMAIALTMGMGVSAPNAGSMDMSMSMSMDVTLSNL